MLQRCYALSPRSRLESSGGTWRLICDHPLQSIALNASAARLLAALRPGLPLEAVAQGVTAEAVALLDGLALRGALRAEYTLLPAQAPPPVHVVIPAHGPVARVGPGLRRCLAALMAQRYPLARVRITVVDDASPQPLEAALQGDLPALPPGLRLRWLRLPRNAGPASARNAGAAAPWPAEAPGDAPWPAEAPGDAPGPAAASEPAPEPAPWLAFVDADCVPAPDWLAGLAALLEDPHVAAAGGAVRGLARVRLLERYEHACSSLFLGERPAPVGLPEGMLAYLPSCNLAVKPGAYADVGGFQEGWRFGEDVDLCWRLHAAGHGLFYHPAAEVAHDHRTRWGAFLQRRRAYGRSEAALRRAHPQRFQALLGPGPALLLGGVALGLLGGAAGPGMAGTARALAVLAAKLAAVLGGVGLVGRPAWLALRGGADAPRWPLRTLLAAGLRRAPARLVAQCRALNRQAALPGLVLVALLPVLWPLAAAVFVAGALGEWWARRPALGAGTFALGYGAECLAYSLGRLEGAAGGALRALRGRGT